MTRHTRWLIVSVALVVAAAAFVAACGDDDGEPIEFGEGEIPRAFPDDIPVPPGAAIGSTLIDRVNHHSEFAFVARTGLTETVQFFLVELVNEGYVVESSEGTALEWSILFTRGDLVGEVTLAAQGVDLAEGVVSINRS